MAGILTINAAFMTRRLIITVDRDQVLGDRVLGDRVLGDRVEYGLVL
jgi:hypothetical protein